MSSALTNYLGNAVLQRFLTDNSSLYLAMFTAFPGYTGSTADEVVGGGVERQSITFGAPAGKLVANTNAIRFSGVPLSPDITHLALMDSPGSGNMLAIWILGSPLDVPTDGQVIITPGDLALEV